MNWGAFRFDRGAKWLLGAIVGAALLAAVAYGMLLLVNLKDEDLSAEAKAFAEAARIDIAPEHNGYFVLHGWRAPEGTDPHSAGRAGFDELVARIREGKHESTEMAGALPRVDSGMLCERQKPSCLNFVRSNRTAVEFQLAKHEILRKRLRALDHYPRFHAPRMPYHPLISVPIGDFGEAWQLGATESGYEWISGRPAQALALSGSRIAVARRMMRDSGDLFPTVLAASWLRSEYLLLADILHREPDASRLHMGEIERLLQPLAPDELQATRWVHGWFAEDLEADRWFPVSTDQRRQVLGPLLLGPDAGFETDWYRRNLPLWFAPAVEAASPMFQPNATANRRLQARLQLAKAAAATTSDVGRIRAQSNATPMPSPDRTWSLYNPIGRRLDTDAREYLYRLHDLDRFRRLVAVQAALVKARVALPDVAAFLSAHAGAIDPATGKPVPWDAARSRLYVEALDQAGAKSEYRRIGEVSGHISIAYRP